MSHWWSVVSLSSAHLTGILTVSFLDQQDGVESPTLCAGDRASAPGTPGHTFGCSWSAVPASFPVSFAAGFLLCLLLNFYSSFTLLVSVFLREPLLTSVSGKAFRILGD